MLLSLPLLLTTAALFIASSSAKSGCSSRSRCAEGYGDCDFDRHCQRGLKCGRNNCRSFDPVRKQFYTSRWDCCYDPNERSDTSQECFLATVGTATGCTACAAITSVLIPLVAAGCGLCAAAATAGTAACRKKRSAAEENQEETLMNSPNIQTILQQTKFRDYRESMEDWMIDRVDLDSLIGGTEIEEAVTNILSVDQAYKSLEKTPRLKLLKENDPEAEKFGRIAMQIWISQKAVADFLSSNSTFYGGPQHTCGAEEFAAMEAVLFKGSVYHFMGQKIVENKDPSPEQIAALKAILEDHKAAYESHCDQDQQQTDLLI